MDNNQHTNRLINEKSPYLLQHAHNPVEWYPWGEEAFQKATAEDKPVFLSVGYSTCHWCHVMERESFEDGDVAKILNENYVAVKVDREERPDIDHIYMAVCQTLTGSGGWPMTIIMTPERKPFFAGTYFPKEGKWGRPGLTEILTAIHNDWEKNKERLVSHAEQVTGLLQEDNDDFSMPPLDKTVFDICYNQLMLDYKTEYGGFGDAPKFPSPHSLMFLMRHWRRTKEAKALEMVEKTLAGMRRGGIYDQLGGGFSRYSTDERWLVPHFEKMSYDNSLLCYVYLEAYQCTGNEDYARVAEEIIAYVLRDMTGPEGEFYSAEDADSEGEEGRFYVWSKREVTRILGAGDGELFCECYDVTGKGNFEGTNILNTIDKDWREIARHNNMTPDRLEEVMRDCRQKLFAARQERERPFKDDKVLTAWNCFMIAALAKAARVLGKEEYSQAAFRALAFIEKRLVNDEGRLLSRYREGEAAYPAIIDGYANLVWALIELFETSQSGELLTKAAHWGAEMLRLFGDKEGGGFYLYGLDSERLIARPKELYDGATPSGNSVAVYALLRLARLTGNELLEQTAGKMFEAFAAEVQFNPKAYTFFLIGYESFINPPRHVVIAGARGQETVCRMWAEAGRAFMPEAVVLLNDALQAAEGGLLSAQVMPAIEGKATAYICENFACREPITDLAVFQAALREGVDK